MSLQGKKTRARRRLSRFALSIGTILATFLSVPGAIAYHLISQDGTRNTTPGDVVATIDWSKLPDKQDQKSSPPLTGLLAKTVTEAERIVRKEPDKSATNVQRESLGTQKQSDLQKVVDQLPGSLVTASFIVLDVQRRPSGPGNFVVFGRIEWSSPTVLSDYQKREIAGINQAADAKIAAANSSHISPNEKQQRIATAQRERESGLLAVRNTADAARPANMAFCLTDDEHVLDWRRGQHRTIHAAIHEVCLYLANANVRGSGGGRRGGGGGVVVGGGGRGGSGGPAPALVQENNDLIYVGAEFILKGIDGIGVVPGPLDGDQTAVEGDATAATTQDSKTP